MNRRQFCKASMLTAGGILVPKNLFSQIIVRGGTVAGGSLGVAASSVVTPSPLVLSQVLGSGRTDTQAGVGMGFTAASTATIVSLGRWVYSGNSLTHVVSLMNAAGTVLTSATVATSGATTGQFKYVSCTPFTLVIGTQYFIVSAEGTDQWGDTSTITCDTSVTGSGGSAWYSAVVSGGVPSQATFVESYVPVSALFTP